MSALCVECDAELNLGGRVRIGQRSVCPSCGVQLEVISVRPLEVDIAYDDADGEEWDELDGFSLDDEDELDDAGRSNGAKAQRGELDDELDELDELDDDLDDLQDELDELDDELDDLDGDWAGEKSAGQ